MSVTGARKSNARRLSMMSVSTKTKYNVQHRSDLLMDEHMINVRQVQFELQSVLQELEAAKTVEEMESLREEAAHLKAQSDKLVLSLQVMNKINSELAYARNDLNDALHQGIGDINAARKRVIWLEDKMGELCGKKRLKSRRPSNRFITGANYSFDTDSDGEQARRMRPLDSSERMYANEQARNQSLTQLLGSEIGFTSESEHMINRHVGFQDMSGQSYESNEVSTSNTGIKGIQSSQEDVSFNTDTVPSAGRIADHRKSFHDSVASLTSGGHAEIAEESGSEKFSVVKEMSVVAPSSAKVTSTPDIHHEGPDDYDKSDDEDNQNEADMNELFDEDHHDENEDEEEQGEERADIDHDLDKQTDISTDSRAMAEEEVEKDNEETEDEGRGGEEGEREEEFKDVNDEIERDNEVNEAEEIEDKEEEGEEKDGKKDRLRTTFITEVSGQVESEGYREGEPDDEEEGERESTHTDLGRDYWESEHHRFEFSDFADILTTMDPLSYHQMGLAVPGSFITREDTSKEFEELPWRPRRKGSDIKDIHRIALDKLATRVHGMYDKVFNATMLSVKGNNQDSNMQREASVFHSYDGSKKPGSSSTRTSGEIPQTAPASLRQRTDDFLPLAVEKGVKRSGTITAGKLVFYPKPIPPPHVLPITRTSLNKEFPHFASHYAKPDPDERKPAERLVDQRNLMEETRLVLFREKIKPSTPGPTRLERKFRKMLESDRAASHKSSDHIVQREKFTAAELRKKLQTSFKTAAVMTKLQGAVGGWNQIKPKSRGNEFAGLRWERVKTIVHMSLASERAEERVDAARQLGMLRCCDTMVFYALKDKLQNDSDDRVRYESAKSLILIGCWEDIVMQSVLKYLVMGNTEIRKDVIDTLIQGKNVQYVNKSVPSFLELVKVLSHLCRNPDPDDVIAFDSAVCLGRLCVKDDSAKTKLLRAMKESKESEIRAKALEILVKQLNCITDDIVSHILLLLQESPVWKFRALACRLLISLGPKHACIISKSDEIYSLLTKKLWDDPNMDVRLAGAKALTALGMFGKACDAVEKNLESADEDLRSQAAISVGTLGMKSEKLIRLLLEMIELDSSDYVRLMIVRTFGTLRLTDKRVLRCLREREKLDGPLARESKKALKILDQAQGGIVSKSLPSALMRANKPFSKKRVLSPIQVAVF